MYLLAGVAGGVLAGMGMGGGTLFIPIVTLFMDVNQITAQAINLVAFVPTAVLALGIHLKNKLVKGKDLAWIIVPSVLSCIGFSFLALMMEGDLLRKLFGGFLTLLGSAMLFSTFYRSHKQKKAEANQKDQLPLPKKAEANQANAPAKASGRAEASIGEKKQ